ncbi:hypothetical protein ASF26_17695 [Methylobacterium sp. Leaf93]|nr:hypothetical protein ASF26_17695 [Methylobacterium sp. Leaf93]
MLLPMMRSFRTGVNSNSSWRMEQARMTSPPVSCLIRLSVRCRPCSVSDPVTRRAPRNAAISVGCPSCLAAVNVSMAAFRA